MILRVGYRSKIVSVVISLLQISFPSTISDLQYLPTYSAVPKELGQVTSPLPARFWEGGVGSDE